MIRHVKKIFLVLGCLAVLVPGGYAQPQTQSPLEDVVNAIRSNRISEISRYFDNIVPVTINNNQSTYSKPQAEVVLRDFFNKNVPMDVVIFNSGSPNNTSKFAIGEFTTSNGRYNLYILLKLKDNSTYLLQEIRINRE